MSPKLVISNLKIIDRSTTVQEFLTILLKNRHLTKDNYKEYLNPPYPALHLPQLQKSVKRIQQAIIKGENILIYGDYDVDGVTSTTILVQTLKKIGAKVTPFLPHREADGYGFKSESFFKFQKLLNLEFSLLVTVDNGIVAGDEFKKTKSIQDIDVIVVDHHLPFCLQNLKSSVFSVVHSTKVSGAALSWFLSSSLDKNVDLGLAALGTVADCMPLLNINRQIVVHGLQSLRLNPSPGIRKLVEISGAKLETLSAYDLGFILGPRINAVGRLSSPIDAFNLLSSGTLEEAGKYASTLNDYNLDRQVLQKESIDEAKKGINTQDKLIFISSSQYHPGVIGLIAGRLTQDYYLPSVVISINGDIAKGSCRSIKEVNIIESLRQFPELFVDVGGHQGAAGFTIYTKNIPKLKSKLTRYLNNLLQKENLVPIIEVDANMILDAVTLSNYKIIQKLEPFGIGNPQPQFVFKKVKISSKRVVGSTGDHLSLKLQDVNAIAFKKGHLDQKLKVGDSIDVVASIDINHWQGHDVPQLIIKEILL